MVITELLVLLEDLSVLGKVLLIKNDVTLNLLDHDRIKNWNKLDGLDDHGLTLCLESDGTGTLCEVELKRAVIVAGGVLNRVSTPACLRLSLRFNLKFNLFLYRIASMKQPFCHLI